MRIKNNVPHKLKFWTSTKNKLKKDVIRKQFRLYPVSSLENEDIDVEQHKIIGYIKLFYEDG